MWNNIKRFITYLTFAVSYNYSKNWNVRTNEMDSRWRPMDTQCYSVPFFFQFFFKNIYLFNLIFYTYFLLQRRSTHIFQRCLHLCYLPFFSKNSCKPLKTPLDGLNTSWPLKTKTNKQKKPRQPTLDFFFSFFFFLDYKQGVCFPMLSGVFHCSGTDLWWWMIIVHWGKADIYLLQRPLMCSVALLDCCTSSFTLCQCDLNVLLWLFAEGGVNEIWRFSSVH